MKNNRQPLTQSELVHIARNQVNRFPRPKFIPSGQSEVWQLRQAFEEADVALNRYFAQRGWK